MRKLISSLTLFAIIFGLSFTLIPTYDAYAGMTTLGTPTSVYEFGSPPKVYTTNQFFSTTAESETCGPKHHHANNGFVVATDGSILDDTEMCGFGDLDPFLQTYNLIFDPVVVDTPLSVEFNTWTETVRPNGELTVGPTGSLAVHGVFVCNGPCDFLPGSFLDVSSTGKFMASDPAILQFEGDLDTSGIITSSDLSVWNFESPSGMPFLNFDSDSITQFSEVTFDITFPDIEGGDGGDMNLDGFIEFTDFVKFGPNTILNSGPMSEIEMNGGNSIFTDGGDGGSIWTNSGIDSIINSASNTFVLTSLFNNTGTFHNLGTFQNNSTGRFFNYEMFNNTGTLNNLGIFHNCLGATFLNSGSIVGNPINQNVDCQALVNSSECSPPISGDWVITENCEISNDTIAPASVTIQNTSVVTVNSPGSLTILSGENIIVVDGSGLKLLQGSTLNVLS